VHAVCAAPPLILLTPHDTFRGPAHLMLSFQCQAVWRSQQLAQRALVCAFHQTFSPLIFGRFVVQEFVVLGNHKRNLIVRQKFSQCLRRRYPGIFKFSDQGGRCGDMTEQRCAANGKQQRHFFQSRHRRKLNPWLPVCFNSSKNAARCRKERSESPVWTV